MMLAGYRIHTDAMSATPKMNPEDAYTPDDDIASMKARLPLPAWQYFDAAAHDDIKLALTRWPLLDELAKPESNTDQA
jgi:hypothetical protein